MPKNQHQKTPIRRHSHDYIIFRILATFWSLWLLFGLLVVFLSLTWPTDGVDLLIGIGIAAVGLGGLIYITVSWRRHDLAYPEGQQGLSEVESLLDQPPPRQHIPKKFYQANALRISDTLGALLAVGIFCPGLTIFMILTCPWPAIIALQILLYGIPGTVLWGAWIWLCITERIKRRRLLRDGIAVEGTLLALEKTSIWTKILFSPQNSTQYRATYRFSWLGEQLEASQLLHATNHHDVDNCWIPGTTEVRLLVLPHDPLSVLWAETTLNSAPLYPSPGD